MLKRGKTAERAQDAARTSGPQPARRAQAMSQERLGLCSGLHRNYVGAIERGEINPTFRVLLQLSDGLERPLSDLIVRYEQSAVRPKPARRRTRGN